MCFQYKELQMQRESDDTVRILVDLMTLVCDDFTDTLTNFTPPKTHLFIVDILYKYHRMIDQGEEVTLSSIIYEFGAYKTLTVDLKECDKQKYPYLVYLKGYNLTVNVKQATLLALIKLKQIIKFKFYQQQFSSTPRSIICFHEYADEMVLKLAISDGIKDKMKTYDEEYVDLIVGVCISPYEGAHLIDGSNCHVAALYVLLFSNKDLQMRNQRLKDVIDAFEYVQKPLNIPKLCIHVDKIFEVPVNGHIHDFVYAKRCDGENNICEQFEEDDLCSLEKFRKYPKVVDVIKTFNEIRQRNCPFKNAHNDFYGLVKLFKEKHV